MSFPYWRSQQKIFHYMDIEEQPFQEIFLNQTKFIFYMPKTQEKPPSQTHRPNTTVASQRKFHKKRSSKQNQITTVTDDTHEPQLKKFNSQNMNNRQGLRNRQSQQHSRCSSRQSPKAQPGTTMKEPNLRSRSNRKSASPSPMKPLNLKKLNLSRTQGSENGKENISKGTSFEKFEQKTEKQETFSNLDARRLLGQHHLLYQENIDFLTIKPTKFQQKNSSEKAQSPQRKAISKPPVPEIKFNSKAKQKSKIVENTAPPPPIESRFIQNFHLDRAPILSYIKNITPANRTLYYQLTKPNAPQEIRDNLQIDFSIRKQVNWVKIAPYTSMNIFPPDHKHKIIPHKNPMSRPVPFIEFLKIIFYLQPEIIIRIIEPPVNNIYSVWLFMDNGYAPVVVDPLFPLYQGYGDNSHCDTLGYPYMWLPILVKAIMKAIPKLCYGGKSMRGVDLHEVFHLLTGLSLQQYDPILERGMKEKVFAITDNGECFVLAKRDPRCSTQLDEDDEQIQELSGFSPYSGNKMLFHLRKGQPRDYQLYKLPISENWFIYSVKAQSQAIIKYELEIQRPTDFILQTSSGSLGTYLYQEVESSSSQSKLVLKIEGRLCAKIGNKFHQIKFRTKPGSYKLLLEQGQKKIHLLFSPEQQNEDSSASGWGQSSFRQETCITMGMLTSHQIKIGGGQVLKKNWRGVVEDSACRYQKSYLQSAEQMA